MDLLLLLNKVVSKDFKVNGHQLKLLHENPQVEEEFVADLSLVLPILCDDVPWMALEEFSSSLFYMLSLFCISLHAYIEDNVHFKCEGKGLQKKKSVVLLYLLYFLFFL